MKKIAVVSLYFLSEAVGGQKRLITGDFSTPIIFDLDKDLEYGLWSAVVELHSKPDEHRETKADLYFLCFDSIDVPNHLLEPGNSFSLRTNRIIAKGKIEYIKDAGTLSEKSEDRQSTYQHLLALTRRNDVCN